jgi:hypothetical protein
MIPLACLFIDTVTVIKNKKIEVTEGEINLVDTRAGNPLCPTTTENFGSNCL